MASVDRAFGGCWRSFSFSFCSVQFVLTWACRVLDFRFRVWVLKMGSFYAKRNAHKEVPILGHNHIPGLNHRPHAPTLLKHPKTPAPSAHNLKRGTAKECRNTLADLPSRTVQRQGYNSKVSGRTPQVRVEGFRLEA